MRSIATSATSTTPRASITCSAATGCSPSCEPPTGGSVLEIACGTGRNLIARRANAIPMRASTVSTFRTRCSTRLRASIARNASGRAHHRGRRRCDGVLSGRTHVWRADLRSRLHLLCAVDDPVLAPVLQQRARGRRSRRAPAGRRLRRAGRAAGLVQESACAPGSPSSRSSRAMIALAELQRWDAVQGLQLRCDASLPRLCHLRLSLRESAMQPTSAQCVSHLRPKKLGTMTPPAHKKGRRGCWRSETEADACRVHARDDGNDGADRPEEVAEEDAEHAVLRKERLAARHHLRVGAERPVAFDRVLEVEADPIGDSSSRAPRQLLPRARPARRQCRRLRRAVR